MNRFCFVLPAAALLVSPIVAFAAALADKVTPAIALEAEPFALEEVRLLDGPFRDALLRDQAYLLSLDADRLLHNFRLTAGLPSSAAPLGGWEATNCEVRGHCLGHYLSACALLYASTGDAELKKRADYIVGQLAKCQQALPAQGYNKGFLSAYPESFFDRVDRGQPVWAPYYTLHKIMAGLLDAWRHCGNSQALDVLTRMADWLKFRVDKLSAEQMQRALRNEHGGMNEVLANLYAVTGRSDYLTLARSFNHEAVLAPLAEGQDKLNGLHANTQFPKIIGAARQYELTGDKRLRDIAQFFWQQAAWHRSYVIGGDSDGEHFFATNAFAAHLTPYTCETCNTYNMLKLTRHLFGWAPSAQLMDFYERGLYNQILASQDPDSGMMTYFVPLQTGRFKTYSTPLDSFWCCVGTGMENHAKYGDTIYWRGPQALYVNLFIPSELHWTEKGLTLRQETKFPANDMITLTFDCAAPTELALRIRHPGWAGQTTVKVNGRTQKLAAEADSYLTIKRVWKNHDKIQVRLPMSLRTEPLPGDPTQVAFLYGPLVLAGRLGVEGLPANGQQAGDQSQFGEMPLPKGFAAPVLSAKAPRREKALTFQVTTTDGRHIQLIPFCQLHHERYAVYWKIVNG